MFELRPYQKPIAANVFNYMRQHPNKHPLVALPTGSGKTVVMADIIHKAITNWPQTKILVLSHVKEILEQDYGALSFHLSALSDKIGINSASIGRRENKQITIAGIQSVYKYGSAFSDVNLVIVDECHLIPPDSDSMYRTFFASLDHPRYFGLTATPFRLSSGLIYGDSDDTIFDDIVVDYTSSNKFVSLIKQGYLCRLKTQATSTRLDTINIGTRGGDFDTAQMSDEFNIKEITTAACKEIIAAGKNYKKWLIFAIDIKHAESIAETLIRLGIKTMVVHSKMDFDRSTIIKLYKEGHFRALVNVNVLTTGFDDPEIDLIALLRPTKSPVIHVQTIGRGLRIAEGKDHCLVLDFAGNTARLGPINDIRVRKMRKGKDPNGEGEAPTKECPNCGVIVPIQTRTCEWCGYEFPRPTALSTKAYKGEIIKEDDGADKRGKWYNVQDITYHLHQKSNRPDMVKVSYYVGMRYFNEYVTLDHTGYARHASLHWVKVRNGTARTTAELLQECPRLRKPSEIKVDTRGKYPSIIDVRFDQ